MKSFGAQTSIVLILLITFLSSCRTTTEVYFASPYNYPEAKQFVECSVDRARVRAFDNPNWVRNDDLDVVIKASMQDCQSVLQALRHALANDGIPDYKFFEFHVQLGKRVWSIAWDEIVRVRKARIE